MSDPKVQASMQLVYEMTDFDLELHMTDKTYRDPVIENQEPQIKAYFEKWPKFELQLFDEVSNLWGDLIYNAKEMAMQREVDLVSTLDDGSGGNNSNNGNKFTGGNRDRGDSNPEGSSEFKKVSADEKYSAYGRIARECLLHNGRTQTGKPSMMQEIRDIQTMRAILSSHNFPYRAAFDLNTRKIYYFVEKNWLNSPKYKEITTTGMYDYIYMNY